MSSPQAKVFDTTRTFSTVGLTVVIALSLIFSRTINEANIAWQVVVALIALALGIPHGALDHLVTLPRANVSRMALFIVIYVAIAVIAVIAILTWNVIGFLVVIVMSALHFGIGDCAFIAESDRLAGKSTASRSAQVVYALAAGSLPVVIPLTNDKSTQALAAVNSKLIDWHRGFDWAIMLVVIALMVVSFIVLLAHKRNRDCVDLAVLAVLAFVAPPLVTFAAYFGLWHAMRHTARLTLNLKRSARAFAEGAAGKAFLAAVVPGTPALVGTLLTSLVIAWRTPGDISDRYLWLSLVVVWALTVPHMMVTVKLDRQALR